MALQLKQAGQDAVAMSWRWNTPATFAMMMTWADYVVLMQEEFLTKVPGMEQFRKKARVVDVGPDVYGNPLHLGLNTFLQKVVQEWSKRNFVL